MVFRVHFTTEPDSWDGGRDGDVSAPGAEHTVTSGFTTGPLIPRFLHGGQSEQSTQCRQVSFPADPNALSCLAGVALLVSPHRRSSVIRDLMKTHQVKANFDWKMPARAQTLSLNRRPADGHRTLCSAVHACL